MTVPSPTADTLPMGSPLSLDAAQSRSAVSEGAAAKGGTLNRFPQSGQTEAGKRGARVGLQRAIACEPDRRGWMSWPCYGPLATAPSSSSLPSSIQPASDGKNVKAADAKTPTA